MRAGVNVVRDLIIFFFNFFFYRIMENIQINGQRIWGPPNNWQGPPPPHGTEIFIKNLPDDVLEMELYRICSAVGQVYEVRLPVHWSGINRGYAFVRFTKITEANAAIKKLDGYPMRPGRHIKVERSIDNTRLFLSAVPNNKTGEEIKKDLLAFVDNVKTVYVYPATENPSLFRGYAFVEFNCHRDAAIAKRILTPDVCFSIFEKKCIAAWANPLPFLNQDILETINILFMRNIPKDMKSVTVKKTVEILIAPDTVQKVKRVKDFAFLTFRNHESARNAMNIIKCNKYVLGQDSEIQIEWAVPRELASADSFEAKESEIPDPSISPNRSNYECMMKSLQNLKNYRQGFMIQNYVNFNHFNSISQKNSQELKSIPIKDVNAVKDIDTQYGFPREFNRMQAKEKPYRSGIKKEVQVPKPLNILPTSVPGNYFNNEEAILRNEWLEGTGDLKNSSPYGEFYIPEAEGSFRNQHLKHWFENLICPPCTPSPTLTNSSVESPTNTSWKYDEGINRTSGGSRFPTAYDSKMIDDKTRRLSQSKFAMYI